MDVLGQHAIADLVARRNVLVGLRRAARAQGLLDVARGQDARAGHRLQGLGVSVQSRLHLVLRHEAVVVQQLLQPECPVLVVAGGQVLGGRHLLAGEARHVDVPLPEEAGGQVERERLALPLAVEDGLVALDLHRPEAVHTAEVVGAVHGFTWATPIIASRVISAASSSSLSLSVPFGRSGSTM